MWCDNGKLGYVKKILGWPSGLESMYTKTRPKAPVKTYKGGQFAVFTKKTRFLAPAKRNYLLFIITETRKFGIKQLDQVGISNINPLSEGRANARNVSFVLFLRKIVDSHQLVSYKICRHHFHTDEHHSFHRNSTFLQRHFRERPRDVEEKRY